MLLKFLTPLALLATAYAICPQPIVTSYNSPQYSQAITFSGYFSPNGQTECNTIRLYRAAQSGTTATPLDVDSTVDPVSGTFTFTYDGATVLADGTYNFVVRLATATGTELSTRSSSFQIQLASSACGFPTAFSIANNAQVTNRKIAIAGTAANDPGCDTLTYTFTSGPRTGQAFTTYYSPGQAFSDSQLYYYDYYLANGQYSLEIAVGSSQNYRPTNTRTINFNVVGGGKCPVPTLTSPPDGSAFFVPANPILSGTVSASRPDCNVVRYTTYDSSGNAYPSYVTASTPSDPSADPTFEISLQGYPYGDFSMELFTAIDYADGIEASDLIEYTYSYNEARCEPPVIVSPTENAYLRTLQPTISGTQTNPAACPFVRLQNFGNGIPDTDNIPVNADGTWSYTPTTDLYESSYYIYPQTYSAAGDQLSSTGLYRYFTIALRCQAPYIITYSTAVDGRNLHVESQGNTNDPDCQTFTFYNNGQLFGTGVPTSDSTVVTLDKTNLPNGAYSLTVTLGQGQLVSEQSSQPYEFTIGSSPSARSLPARSTCKGDESSCPFKTAHGRTIYECVADLATNIERCGSCGGPDCTAIPNISTVGCVEGACIVSACAEGFELFDNSCIRPIGLA